MRKLLWLLLRLLRLHITLVERKPKVISEDFALILLHSRLQQTLEQLNLIHHRLDEGEEGVDDAHHGYSTRLLGLDLPHEGDEHLQAVHQPGHEEAHHHEVGEEVQGGGEQAEGGLRSGGGQLISGELEGGNLGGDLVQAFARKAVQLSHLVSQRGGNVRSNRILGLVEDIAYSSLHLVVDWVGGGGTVQCGGDRHSVVDERNLQSLLTKLEVLRRDGCSGNSSLVYGDDTFVFGRSHFSSR